VVCGSFGAMRLAVARATPLHLPSFATWWLASYKVSRTMLPANSLTFIRVRSWVLTHTTGRRGCWSVGLSLFNAAYQDTECRSATHQDAECRSATHQDTECRSATHQDAECETRQDGTQHHQLYLDALVAEEARVRSAALTRWRLVAAAEEHVLVKRLRGALRCQDQKAAYDLAPHSRCEKGADACDDDDDDGTKGHDSCDENARLAEFAGPQEWTPMHGPRSMHLGGSKGQETGRGKANDEGCGGRMSAAAHACASVVTSMCPSAVLACLSLSPSSISSALVPTPLPSVTMVATEVLPDLICQDNKGEGVCDESINRLQSPSRASPSCFSSMHIVEEGIVTAEGEGTRGSVSKASVTSVVAKSLFPKGLLTKVAQLGMVCRVQGLTDAAILALIRSPCHVHVLGDLLARLREKETVGEGEGQRRMLPPSLYSTIQYAREADGR